MFYSFADAIYAFVLATRKVKTSEMVRGSSGQAEEENNTRADHDHSCEKAKNVLIPGVERL